MAKKQSESQASEPIIEVPQLPATTEFESEPQLISDGQLSAMNRPRWRGSPVVSSFDPSHPDGKKHIFNALSGASRPIRDAVGLVIPLVGFVAQRGVVNDGEGKEPRLGVKLLLVASNGDRFYTTAQSMLAAVDQLTVVFGNGPFDPPIPVRVVRSTTQAGRPWYAMELV